jgi:cysteine/glycine-rich protein
MDTLTSLPVHFLMQQQQERTTEEGSVTTTITTATASLTPTFDPDLAELLKRRKAVITTQAPTCAKCNKRVYMAEEVRAANKTFHKLCFKCTSCNGLLQASTLSDHQGEMYCKNCYGKNFGPKGYGFGVGAGIMSSTQLSPLTTKNESPVVIVNENTNNPNVLKPSYTTLPSGGELA